jgi:hypothetical protein
MSQPSTIERFSIRDLDATLAHLNENACGVALVVDGSGDVVTIADDPSPIPYALTVAHPVTQPRAAIQQTAGRPQWVQDAPTLVPSGSGVEQLEWRTASSRDAVRGPPSFLRSTEAPTSRRANRSMR